MRRGEKSRLEGEGKGGGETERLGRRWDDFFLSLLLRSGKGVEINGKREEEAFLYPSSLGGRGKVAWVHEKAPSPSLFLLFCCCWPMY